MKKQEAAEKYIKKLREAEVGALELNFSNFNGPLHIIGFTVFQYAPSGSFEVPAGSIEMKNSWRFDIFMKDAYFPDGKKYRLEFRKGDSFVWWDLDDHEYSYLLKTSRTVLEEKQTGVKDKEKKALIDLIKTF
jgi:hypothetical protein